MMSAPIICFSIHRLYETGGNVKNVTFANPLGRRYNYNNIEMTQGETMAEKTMVRNMTEGSIPGHLARFALPMLLANCLQALYTTVDTLVVGRVVGTAGLSAVANCAELITFYTLVAMGFASAGQIIIAQYVGKDDRPSISRTIGALFTFLFVFSLLCSLFSCLTVRWQLRLLNLPAEAMPGGVQYTTVCSLGFVFTFLYNAISAVLRGMGDSKRPLVFVAISSGTNLVLDVLFVAVFRWGPLGAAVATTFSQAVSVVISLVYLYRHREAFGFDFRPASFRPEGRYLKTLLRLGIPMACQFAAVLFSIVFIASRVNVYGVAASAANGVANKLENIVRIVPQSIGLAGSAMVAQNIAAGKQGRVTRILLCTLVLCGAWGLLCGLTMYAFPERIFALFDASAEVQAYGRMFAPAGLIGYVGNGLRATTNALLNGIGFATLSLISGLIDSVAARIGFSLLLANGAGLGIYGFWLGSALAGYVPVLIGGVYYLTGRWRSFQLLREDRH